MALKWTLLFVAAFIATVSAVTDTSQDIPMPMPTSVMPDAMVPSTSPAVSPSPTPPPMTQPSASEELQGRFDMSLAEDVRANHFYCLDVNGAREDFQAVTSERWGLWMQYPVLSYLDTMRKRHLFYVISQMVAAGGQSAIFNDICVAEVQHYAVSTYSESVFVKLYLRGTPDEARYDSIDRAFRSQYIASNAYTAMFRGQVALNVSTVTPSGDGPVLNNRTVFDSVLAGCDEDACPDGDPTLLAVVLGTYVGTWNYTSGTESGEVTVDTLRRNIDGYQPLANFVSNPNPFNFGLEAGDIVFAVFGSIFLTLLVGAIVVGFFIHPFFFA